MKNQSVDSIIKNKQSTFQCPNYLNGGCQKYVKPLDEKQLTCLLWSSIFKRCTADDNLGIILDQW